MSRRKRGHPRKAKGYSKFTLGALHTLAANPGLTATRFASLYWPHLRKGGLLASLKLAKLCDLKLIRPQFVPPFHKPGPVMPEKRYYLTDKGYTVHDTDARQSAAQSAAQNGDPSNSDRTGRTSDGPGVDG